MVREVARVNAAPEEAELLGKGTMAESQGIRGGILEDEYWRNSEDA